MRNSKKPTQAARSCKGGSCSIYNSSLRLPPQATASSAAWLKMAKPLLKLKLLHTAAPLALCVLLMMADRSVECKWLAAEHSESSQSAPTTTTTTTATSTTPPTRGSNQQGEGWIPLRDFKANNGSSSKVDGMRAAESRSGKLYSELLAPAQPPTQMNRLQQQQQQQVGLNENSLPARPTAAPSQIQPEASASVMSETRLHRSHRSQLRRPQRQLSEESAEASESDPSDNYYDESEDEQAAPAARLRARERLSGRGSEWRETKGARSGSASQAHLRGSYGAERSKNNNRHRSGYGLPPPPTKSQGDENEQGGNGGNGEEQVSNGSPEQEQDEAAATNEQKEQEAAEASEAEAADRAALDEQQQQQREIIKAQAESEARAIREQQEALMSQQRLHQQMVLRRAHDLASNRSYGDYTNQENAIHHGNQNQKNNHKRNHPKSHHQRDRHHQQQEQSSSNQRATRLRNQSRNERRRASNEQLSGEGDNSETRPRAHRVRIPAAAQIDIQFSDQPDGNNGAGDSTQAEPTQRSSANEQQEDEAREYSVLRAAIATEAPVASADESVQVAQELTAQQQQEAIATALALADADLEPGKDSPQTADSKQQHQYGAHYGALHKHQNKYYQFAESHKKGQYDSGFKRGGKKFQISGHSSQHKSHAEGHVKWHGKKGKGSQYWDFKHKDHSKHKHHH